MAGGSRQTSADSTGAWTMTVDLRRGQERVQVRRDRPGDRQARRAARPGRHHRAGQRDRGADADDRPARRGTTFENGAIPVQGTAANATSVTITRDLRRPGRRGAARPSAGPSRRAERSAGPGRRSPSRSGRRHLGHRRQPAPADDRPLDDHGHRLEREDESRRPCRVHVAVAYKGVNLVVKIKGGSAWIKVWVDGKIDETVGRAGRTLPRRPGPDVHRQGPRSRSGPARRGRRSSP